MNTESLTKGERTASRILDAAEALFARKGYEAASLREIAALVGIHQPGLYNHYSSKEDLYRAVLDRGLQPLEDLMLARLESSIAREDLFDLPAQLTDLLALHPHMSALLMQSMHVEDSEGAAIAHEWLDRLLKLGVRVNKAANSQGDQDFVWLKVIALFNVSCGFFRAAPLVRRLTKADILSPKLLTAQKQIQERIVRALT